MNKNLERLINFIKQYPDLWDEKSKVDYKDDKAVAKFIDEYISQQGDIEDTREALIAKYKLAEQDYSYVRNKKVHNLLGKEELNAAKEGNIGRTIGYKKEIKELSQGKKNRVTFERYLYKYDKKYGGLDNFRKHYIEQLATNGNLGDISYIDGLVPIHFDISSPTLHNDRYDLLYDDIMEEQNSGVKFRVLDVKSIKTAMIEKLNKKEREMLELKYGLKDETQKNNEEIGKIYGITRQGVGKIEKNGLIKLRQYNNYEKSLCMNLNQKEVEEFIRVYFENRDIFKNNEESKVDPYTLGTLLRIVNNREEVKKAKEKSNKKKTATPLKELGLSFRTYNALMRAGITTVEELTSMSKLDLKNHEGIGNNLITYIEKALHSKELDFLENKGQALSNLGLSMRTYKSLENGGIKTIEDVISRTKEELLVIKNFGENTYAELSDKIHSIGLKFADEKESVLKSGVEATKLSSRTGAINQQIENVKKMQDMKELSKEGNKGDNNEKY